MKKSGNPGRPGNGSPGMKTLLTTYTVYDDKFIREQNVCLD